MVLNVDTQDTEPDVAPEQERRAQIGEMITAAVTLALWGVVWTQVQDFPDAAAGYPRFVLLCLFIFSTIYLLQAIWRYRRAARGVTVMVEASTPGGRDADSDGEATAAPEESDEPTKVKPTLALMLGALVYVLAIPRLGFFVSTFVFLVIGVCTSIGWSVKRVAALALGIALIYVLMVTLFGIRMPTGLLI